MTDDPLSAVLAVIDARAVYTGGFVAGGDFAIRFPPPDKVKIFTLARGRCRLTIDDEPTPIELTEGDLFVLAAPRGFLFSAGRSVPPRAAEDVFAEIRAGVFSLGGGEDLLLLGSHIDVGADARPLLDALPPYLRIAAAGSGAEALRALVQLMLREVDTGAGAAQARAALAQLIFLEVLRVAFAQPDALPPGWLRALGDPRLAPALKLMHADPARDWHLPDLARAAGMSRTAFAVRFKAAAGLAPLAYLTLWRMRLAEQGLRAGTPIARLARSVGYASEAAFSTAFKRVAGMSPTMARRREASAEA